MRSFALPFGLALALVTLAPRAFAQDEPSAPSAPAADAGSPPAEGDAQPTAPAAPPTTPAAAKAPDAAPEPVAKGAPAAEPAPAPSEPKKPSRGVRDAERKKKGHASNSHEDKSAFHHGTGHHDAEEEATHPAVLPVLGGSSDIGFMFGLAGAVSHVAPGYHPHKWFGSGLFSLSVRDGEIVQQAARLRLDFPHFMGTEWRVMPGVTYDRTINRPYFGIGNMAPLTIDPVTGELPGGNLYKYPTRDLRVRVYAERELDGPWEIITGLQVRYTNPEPYPGSQLERDAIGDPARGIAPLIGVHEHTAVIPQLGIIYDTRDDEVMPKEGSLHMAAVRLSMAFPTSSRVRSFAFDTTLRKYFHLGGPFIFAVRLIGDFTFGNPAYYDYITGGSFGTFDFLGGALGVRGVPAGRFGGLAKVAANSELRFMYPWTKIFGAKFRAGHAVFFDTGRSFVDYGTADPRDGELWRLHWGAGGALYIQLNEALFRAELAYSPDAAAVNPSFPFGFYLMDGVMF
ncbi:MAG: BamA/TamA family outer membrane protein [Myxococcales bacterium]|nr:BamA/TamA family outer membrane protein [Myxococcales bacterium]